LNILAKKNANTTKLRIIRIFSLFILKILLQNKDRSFG